jgi:hypothetical protein
MGIYGRLLHTSSNFIKFAMVIYNGIQNMAMRKVTVAMTDQMYKDLEKETKKRRLASVAETTRVVIGEYLWHNNEA